jgi:hypothetical protein
MLELYISIAQPGHYHKACKSEDNKAFELEEVGLMDRANL